ncbi:hypothetical protein CBS101457_003307 [Exobasidium rhododendri]|nr:hypothetical protein CBS101457_003307 [Exobasidium rhododendri]
MASDQAWTEYSAGSALYAPITSQTPVRPNKASVQKQSSYHKTSSSNASTSDPQKSFLVLSGESSPVVDTFASTSYSASRSDSPTSGSFNRATTSRSRASASKTNQFDADSSFFSMTSPLASRLGLNVGNAGEEESDEESEGGPSVGEVGSANSRGTRLGIQMGRTPSNQSYTASNPNEKIPVETAATSKPAGNNTGLYSSKYTTPTKKGDMSLTGQNTRMKPLLQHQSSSGSRESSQKQFNGSSPNGVASLTARWDNIAGSSVRSNRESLAKLEAEERRAGLYQDEAFSQRNPLSLSASSRRRQAESDHYRGAGKESITSTSSASLFRNGGTKLSGASSYSDNDDDVAVAATATTVFSSSSSRARQLEKAASSVTATNLSSRVGRLSQLQYSRGDAIANSTGPGWNTSNVSGRGVYEQSRRALLQGRGSNSNMLADYRAGESVDDERRKPQHNSHSPISSNAQELAATQPSSGNDPSSRSSSRSGDRRELYLPALNEMRSAVQGAVTSPTESFMKRGDRRRSYNAQNMNSSGINGAQESREEGGGVHPAEYAHHHQKTPSQSTTASPAMTEGTWQSIHDESASVLNKYIPSSSSSPASRQTTAYTRENRGDRNKFASRQGSARLGQLSDEAIMQLGAIPGQDTRSSLGPSKGQSLSSKTVLTIALQKAQNAVLLDSSNNVPDAIMAYRQAVRLLEEVMERVSPNKSTGSSRKNGREEERRRLKVIHDTYADRIRLLSMIHSPAGGDAEHDESSAGQDSFSSRRSVSIDSGTLHANEARTVQRSGEQEQDRNMPVIAISAEPSSISPITYQSKMRRPGVSAAMQDDEEELLQNEIVERKARGTSLQRSDSDSSYRSAQLPAAASKSATQSGVQSSNGRSRLPSSNLLHVGVGGGGGGGGGGAGNGDDGLVTPSTPFFDADPHLIGAGEDSAGMYVRREDEGEEVPGAMQRQVSAQSSSSSPPQTQAQLPLTTSSSKALSASRPIALPQDRNHAGFSSLDDVPTANSIKANGNRPPTQSSRRYLSLGSDAHLQDHFQSSSASAAQESSEVVKAATKRDIERNGTSSNVSNSTLRQTLSNTIARPRAMTTVDGNRPTEYVRNLVSDNVSKGTISQRRKGAGGSGNNKAMKGQGGSDDEKGRDPTNVKSAGAEDGVSSGALLLGDDHTGSFESSAVGRKRAISQPGSRRPSIPASFMLGAQNLPGSPLGPPPVPRIKRKSSMPLSPMLILQQGGNPPQGTVRANPAGQSTTTAAFRFPSPAFSTSSGYHALGTPTTTYPTYSWSGHSAGGAANGEETGSILSDLFSTPLPSMQMGVVPSFLSNSQPTTLPWMGITNSLPDSNSLTLPPTQKNLRPFHMMKLLYASIERGSYVTKRLYIPQDLWQQQGSRLLAIDSKVRMMESVSSAIDGIDQAGHFLLHTTYSEQPGLNAINAAKFLKVLEEFETLLVEVQNTLAKKLGFLETVAGKKAGSSFGSLGSRFSRSLDRMTNNSKNVETSATYVDGLSQLFVRAQVLGDHLSTLYRSKRCKDDLYSPIPSTRDTEWDRISIDSYATLPAELKSKIEVKLKRFSEFFTNVVLRFVLRDVAILMDK